MQRRSKRLHINKANKKFLGVCAGIADYLEVEAWSVRVVFLASCLMGAWFLVPIYFVLYFCLDSKSGEFKEGFTNSTRFKHFKNVDYRKKLYRNTEDAKFLGVCAGLADYFEIDASIVRIVTCILFFLPLAGPIPWFAYLAAYFVLDEKPVLQLNHESGKPEENLKKNKREKKIKPENHSNRREFRSCARKFGILQNRLAKLEAYVTSNRFKLHQEFKSIS